MTDAPPVPEALTHRRVLAIAVPIVVSNATVPILGAVDTGVVGQLGEAAPIGAVGVGAVILTAIYWIFGFLRMGTTGLAAQAAGQGNSAEVAALLTRVLMVGVVGGLGIILLQWPLFLGAFAISPASAEVEALARDYMQIRVWSAPALISIYGITGWLIAAERTRGVLAIQVAMNALNIGLDLIFVLGFGWGVQGVAIATVIAEWSGFALGLWLCRDAFGVPAWRDWGRVFDRERVVNMVRVNTDILIRSVLLQAIFVSFLLYGSDFGDVPLAANQVLLQFLHITAFALDGFAFAAEALVGQALGAYRRDTLRRASWLTSLWGLGTCVLLSALFALAGTAIIDLMATDEGVRAAARLYLPWMVAAPLVGLAPWMLDGIFIGATRTADMRNMMIVSAVLYFVAVYPLMAAFGNHGLWAGLLLSFAVRGLTLGLRYPALERQAERPGVSPAQ
ncbi:MATE family efflux transporter [Histidinibacterium aquaticum]|uniref:MATE family efflux transporter n=1 Tax=Histidinibacterium aquaticum TaxID=2613962 RepID=A0A5J5GKX6_9RHOB|nr:MATE family efflux transporter [Histidinibacterium aquaticum]KAA9008288.1 MATE family efflux transporter [Histidinibacterium aquaticum]